MSRQELRPKNKQLGLMVVLLSVVIAFMVYIGKCSRPAGPTFHSKEVVKSGGDTLDIAIQMNPTVYCVKGDTITGRDYEILTEISRVKGVAMKFHPFVSLEWALDGLRQGTFDMVAASMPMTTSLKDEYLMTDPVYVDREMLVQLRDSATLITGQMQLGGDTVWIPAGSSVRQRIENLAEEIGDTIYIRSDEGYSGEALFLLVARGSIRYAVVNEEIARAHTDRYPQVDASLPVSFSQFQSWAIRKDNNALCDSVNAWLKEVVEN